MVNKGNFLIALLIIVTIAQIYIMFFHDPVALSKRGLEEPRILLQGHDPGVPQPVPGKEPEQEMEKVTVQNIGASPKPVVPAGHGEGQAEPKVPLSVRPKSPIIPGIPEDIKTFKFSIQGGDEYYNAISYGVIMLEEDKDLAITREQAIQIKKIMDMRQGTYDAVPKAQDTLMQTLTEDQLRYIYLQMCLKRGGSRPLPPESLEKYSKTVLTLLKKRLQTQ